MVYQDLLDKRKTFRCRLDWTELGGGGGRVVSRGNKGWLG